MVTSVTSRYIGIYLCGWRTNLTFTSVLQTRDSTVPLRLQPSHVRPRQSAVPSKHQLRHVRPRHSDFPPKHQPRHITKAPCLWISSSIVRLRSLLRYVLYLTPPSSSIHSKSSSYILSITFPSDILPFSSVIQFRPQLGVDYITSPSHILSLKHPSSLSWPDDIFKYPSR